MTFTPIGETLGDTMKKQSTLKKQVDASQAVEIAVSVFQEMFPGDLAKHANPLFLKNRTLTVSCTSSAMAQEIRMRQSEIVDKINGELGSNDVDRIRYLA